MSAGRPGRPPEVKGARERTSELVVYSGRREQRRERVLRIVAEHAAHVLDFADWRDALAVLNMPVARA